MATGTIELMPGLAVQPDGSANNVPCGMTRQQGTQATRKAHFLTLDFDGAGATIESCHFNFRVPIDYASGGTLKLTWIANAVAGSVKWQAQVSAVTPGDVDTPIEHAFAAAASVTTAANATEANRDTESAITLTMDGAAAGDTVDLVVFRDPADAADTCTVDARIRAAVFEYTTT